MQDIRQKILIVKRNVQTLRVRIVGSNGKIAAILAHVIKGFFRMFVQSENLFWVVLQHEIYHLIILKSKDMLKLA